MGETGSKLAAYAAFALAAALLVAALSACSTIDRVRGKDSETVARNVAPEDPLARPTQVGWTSARASHCGFIFNPAELRSNFLAAEIRSGIPQEQMKKIAEAYDYTLESVTATIKDNLNYCTKERTAAIRTDLNRYLAGDYTPSARMAR